MNGWILAILPLAGVLVGAGLQFFANRALEQRKHLSQLRADAYADYFRAVSALATEGKSAAMNRDLADAKSRICLYGTARVVRKLAELEPLGASLGADIAKAAVVELVTEARKDTACGPHPVSPEDLRMVLFGPDKSQTPLIPANAGTQ